MTATDLLHDNRSTPEAVAQGLAYLRSSCDRLGVPRARVSFDAAFQDSFALTEADTLLPAKLDADLDFQLGEEAFSAMLALMLPASRNSFEEDRLRCLARVVTSCRQRWRFRFFLDEAAFPPDTDCTAVASAALYEHGLIQREELIGFARELLRAAAPDDRAARGRDDAVRRGVLMVYWEDGDTSSGRSRGRKHDAVACVNALYVLCCAQELGMDDPTGTVETTTRYVTNHLDSGRYLEGTRYYPSPEAFLYATSRLCKRFAGLREVLATRLERAIMALETDPDEQRHCALNRALRTSAADNVGLQAGQEDRRSVLAAQQAPNGSWPASAYYKLGRYPVYFGSPGLTTLFAVQALHGASAAD